MPLQAAPPHHGLGIKLWSHGIAGIRSELARDPSGTDLRSHNGFGYLGRAIGAESSSRRGYELLQVSTCYISILRTQCRDKTFLSFVLVE